MESVLGCRISLRIPESSAVHASVRHRVQNVPDNRCDPLNPYPIIIIIGRLENSASTNADGIRNLSDLPALTAFTASRASGFETLEAHCSSKEKLSRCDNSQAMLMPEWASWVN